MFVERVILSTLRLGVQCGQLAALNQIEALPDSKLANATCQHFTRNGAQKQTTRIFC